MSRDIKFRAVDVYNEVHYGVVPLPDGNVADVIDSECVEPWQSDHPKAIQQYTGLKDKNGKEIYEGDILGTGTEFPPFVVEWIKDRLGWGLNIFSEKHYEIIGNIYKNPELLK